MSIVVPAEGAILQRILETYPLPNQGLTRQAFAKCDSALRKTAWALRHERRLALVEGAHLLASAQRYEFTGTLAQRQVRICGIGALFADPAHEDGGHAPELLEWLLEDAREQGADVALISIASDRMFSVPEGFDVIPTMDVELSVAESPRRGAPMTLVRGGEDRDLAAIVDMGRTRARQFRFHLDRDVDLVKYAITKKRLLAGLAAAGVRQLQFVIAEEGITAAAYAVITIVNRTWTVEECGDRDPSGARVGAILQALIAQEPAERRAVVRAWLPTGFVPPQVTVVSARPSQEVLMLRVLSSTTVRPRLSTEDVLFWRSDIF